MEIFRESGVGTSFVVPLINVANRPYYLSAASLHPNDIRVLRHTGGIWNNAPITTMPTEILSATGLYNFTLSNTEVTPDDTQYPVIVKCHQASATTWDDQTVVVWTKQVPVEVKSIRAAAIDADAFTAGAITTSALANGIFTAPKFPAGALATSAFANNFLTAALIAPSAIGSSQLSTNAIGPAQIAASAFNVTNFTPGSLIGQTVLSVSGGVGWVIAPQTAVLGTSAITSSTFATGAITQAAVADGALTSQKFGTGAFTAPIFATGALTTSAFANSFLTNGLIATSAIQAGNFGTGAISLAAIADNALAAQKFASSALTSAKFSTGAINAAAIADSAIIASKIAAGAFTAPAFAAGTLTTSAFANSFLTNALIGLSAIQAGNFGTGAISLAAIADNALAAQKFASSALTSTKFSTGAINAAAIADSAIIASKISAGAFTAPAFAAGALTTSAFANNFLTNALIGLSAIQAGNFGTAAISLAAIADAALTSQKFADGAFTAPKFPAGAFTTSAFANNSITSAVFAQNAADEIWLSTLNKVGNPIALDSGVATVAGMLTKMADDNSGITFDATTDSLNAIKAAVVAGVPSYSYATSGQLISGTNVANSYSATFFDNGIYWQTTPNGTVQLDEKLMFAIGTKSPSSVFINGRYQAAANRFVNIFAWNYTTSSWNQISDSTTRMNNSNTDANYEYLLSNVHVDGTSAGNAQIRFLSDDANAGRNLYLDLVTIKAVAAGASTSEIANAVYLKFKYNIYGGVVWIDTNVGQPGTEIGVNGIPGNPVNNLADAYIIATEIGTKTYNMASESSITLDRNYDGWTFDGHCYIDMNGQSLEHTFFLDCETISGTATSYGMQFRDCDFGNATVPTCHFHECTFSDTVNLTSGANVTLFSCVDGLPGGAGLPSFVFESSASAGFRDWKGGLRLMSMDSTNDVKIDGAGRVVICSACTGGNIVIRGFYTIEDEVPGGFQGTITDISRYDITRPVGSVTNPVIVGLLNTGAISANAFAAGSLTTSAFANNFLTHALIANSAIDNTNFATGAINAAALADSAIIASKIGTNALINQTVLSVSGGIGWVNNPVTAILGTSAITSNTFATGAISLASIADGALTSQKFGTNALINQQVLSVSGSVASVTNPVTVGFFNIGAIDANAFAAGALTTSAFANSFLTNAKIGTSAIQAGNFGTGAISLAAIADNALAAQKFASSAFTSAKFSTGAINAAAIADNALAASKFATGAITSAKFAAGAINAPVFAAGAITTSAFANNTITSATIADFTINTNKFANCAFTAPKFCTSALMFTEVLSARFIDKIDYSLANASISNSTFSEILNTNIISISGSQEAAAKLSKSAITMTIGTITSATLLPSTTIFEVADIVTSDNDFYKDRALIFVSGNLKGQAKVISSYSLVSGKGRFTLLSALTNAPVHNDIFIVV
jgi:trimeric autotransporter adhesin